MVSIEEASNDLLNCAVFLAGKIKSNEGRAAAAETIIHYLLEKNDVDAAAELADSLNDPFSRDKLLADVVKKCVDIEDDDYAFQLLDAIDNVGTKNYAEQNIAEQFAARGKLDEALRIAENLAYPQEVYAAIAVSQAIRGNEPLFFQTLEMIDIATPRVGALLEIAQHHFDTENAQRAIDLIDKATNEVSEIDYAEEKVRAYLMIAATCILFGKKDKAIRIYDKALNITEEIDGAHKDNLFVNTAIGFLKAGSVDLADNALDRVQDSTQVADCLIGFSQVYLEEEDLQQSLEALEEAYAILRSQKDNEIRSSQTRHKLYGAIARQFANIEKPERALEIAHENPDKQEKFAALSQIAQICTLKFNDEMAKQALKGIDDDSQKIVVLATISDLKSNQNNTASSLENLNEAAQLTETISQFILRAETQLEIIKRFYKLGEAEQAREMASENLKLIDQIKGKENRSVALAQLSEVYDNFNFSLAPDDLEILQQLVLSA